MRIGYARVSTEEQNEDVSIEDLKEGEIAAEQEDTESTKT